MASLSQGVHNCVSLSQASYLYDVAQCYFYIAFGLVFVYCPVWLKRDEWHFLSRAGQEVFYGTVSLFFFFPLWRPSHILMSPHMLFIPARDGKRAAVCHPERTSCFLEWIHQLGPWHLVICDDHRKPYIIKCQTQVLGWSFATDAMRSTVQRTNAADAAPLSTLSLKTLNPRRL